MWIRLATNVKNAAVYSAVRTATAGCSPGPLLLLDPAAPSTPTHMDKAATAPPRTSRTVPQRALPDRGRSTPTVTSPRSDATSAGDPYRFLAVDHRRDHVADVAAGAEPDPTLMRDQLRVAGPGAVADGGLARAGRPHYLHPFLDVLDEGDRCYY
jgi:hypothetical protein